MLLLFTDGRAESQAPSRRFYETGALAHLLEGMDTAGLSARKILDQVPVEVRLFAAGASQHDDITAVAVKVY